MLAFRHPFHLVTLSPWPMAMAMSLFTFAVGLIGSIRLSSRCLWLGAASILMTFIFWMQDVIRESQAGDHTTAVARGFLMGFLLFLASEIMIFFGFFWSYFHHALAPTYGWPTVGIEAIDPTNLPLLGTLLLLISGVAATVAHHSIVVGHKGITMAYLGLTILLGAFFVALQATEYRWAPFSIYDSTYGAVFFMTTGLHGLHVIIGLLFITVVTYLLGWHPTATREQHLGLDLALFYWHMVDVVWLFVYVVYYWWPF